MFEQHKNCNFKIPETHNTLVGKTIDSKSVSKRQQIWELSAGWQCSIIGTCLPLTDLNILAKKLKINISQDSFQEYQLHGFFAHETQKQSKVSKMVQKTLDRRHQLAIKKTRKLSVSELSDYWKLALASGDIPGPYWALLTHPKVYEDLSEQMFADVHMLSHLVGASNRADIKQLKRLDAELAVVNEKFKHRRKLFLKKLIRKNHEIRHLRNIYSELSSKTEFKKRMSSPNKDHKSNQDLTQLESKIDKLNTELKVAKTITKKQEIELVRINNLNEAMAQELLFNERRIQLSNRRSNLVRKIDLQGSFILYVGGRKNIINKLRSYVENNNGTFVHHDGGLESSMKELGPQVIQADRIYFPVDCISHSAMNVVKRTCNQKAHSSYTPLRSSSMSAFKLALEAHFESGI
jgi:hypothetical protein